MGGLSETQKKMEKIKKVGSNPALDASIVNTIMKRKNGIVTEKETVEEFLERGGEIKVCKPKLTAKK